MHANIFSIGPRSGSSGPFGAPQAHFQGKTNALPVVKQARSDPSHRNEGAVGVHCSTRNDFGQWVSSWEKVATAGEAPTF